MADYLEMARAALIRAAAPMVDECVACSGTRPPFALSSANAIRQADPTAEVSRATSVLNAAGVRIIRADGDFILGIWSDLDGPEIRAALRTLEMDQLPCRYLDGPRIPVHYKLRRVNGQPVPMDVINAMELSPEKPWEVRDRMLGKMGSRKLALSKFGQ